MSNRIDRNLAGFTGVGYTRGRGFIHQAVWVAVSNLVFQRWWCPNQLRISLLRVFGAEIGADVIIRENVKVHWPWKLRIGQNSWIGDGAWILNLEPVTIGRDVCISQSVLICTGSHDYKSPTFEFKNRPIVLDDGVWLAARSTVLAGVRIGANSVIGATALVAKDVCEGSLIVAAVGQARTIEH